MGEGFALLGLTGVICEAIVIGVLTFAVARWVTSRHVSLLCIGLGFVMQPVLFERGLLGVAETLGQMAQPAIVIAVSYAVFVDKPGPRTKRRPPGGHAEARLSEASGALLRRPT